MTFPTILSILFFSSPSQVDRMSSTDEAFSAQKSRMGRVATDRPQPEPMSPMEPFLGPNKAAVLKQLRRHDGSDLEITLGKDQPQFIVRIQGARWQLLPLYLDQKLEDEARKTDIGDYYMPEMMCRSLRPGAPLIDEKTSADFVRKLRVWEGWKGL
jgi:hypothetical protein